MHTTDRFGSGKPGKQRTAPPRAATVALVVCALLIGVFVRLRLLGAQVLVDDEWHSLSFVIGRPLSWVLTRFAVPSGFTSIPLNLHAWLLLHTVGWSEWLLRLPSVVFGLLLLALLPIAARPLAGSRAAARLALLLAALSPLLVFYARLARPYSAVACLGFLAVVFAARWILTGRLREGVLYAVCGVLAVYAHPFAAIAVGVAGATVLTAAVARRLVPGPSASASPLRWPPVAVVLAAMGLAGCVLMLPAFLNALDASFADVARQGVPRPTSFLRLASLMCGTANPVLGALFWVLVVIGWLDLRRRHPWPAAMFAALFPFQVLGLLALRPHSCHVGIVLARYSIVLVPVCLLLVARGLDAALRALSARRPLRPALRELLGAAFAAALLLSGPLPRTCSAPNNFIHHGAFQHDYAAMDWSRSFDSEFAPPGFSVNTVIRTAELSPFYGYLRGRPGRRPIVEYPMMIGDHFNPLYFYQWYHRRPVIVGYSTGLVTPAPLRGGGGYGNTVIDEVLNLVDDPARLRFRNLADLSDPAALRRHGTEYAVLHKRFEAQFSRLGPPPAAMPALLERFRHAWHTVYEDTALAVFSPDPVPRIDGGPPPPPPPPPETQSRDQQGGTP